jgi:small conductance mechanosensitive channel
MRADRLSTCLLFVVLLAGLSSPAQPQEAGAPEPPAATRTQGSADPDDESSPANRTVDELSDAERLLRMQQVVTTDEAKLQRLRSDLESRQTFLDELTGRMAEFQTTWDEMQARLEELEPGSDEESRLRDEISRLEQEYERFNRHASLTFEAEGALRKQIRNLEAKIVTDRRALETFRFRTPEAEVGPGGAARPPSPVAPAPSPAAPPVLTPLPGVPLTDAGAPPREQERPLLAETTEQIEARQELARKREVARRAEAAVVTFVQRKEALEVQIGLEETLLDVDGKALENLQGYLADRRQRLVELEAAGASARELSEPRVQRERLDAEIERVSGEVDRRRVELDALRERLVYATGEMNRVTEYAEERRQEAESARKWLVWIESPLYPGNLARWAVERGPRVLAVLLLAGLMLLLIRFSLRRIARALVTKSRKARATAVNRADTLAFSFQSLATTVIFGACVLLVLQEAGLDVKTVLGGAAILGVAIAFGAQNLMRDYFTGFMMLLEDQYELGDLVTIGKITGTVERVNMRVTMLRDLEGRVHFIPNGQIGSLTNRTYDWARALVDVPVDPEQDVDRIMDLLLEVAKGLKADPEWAEEIVDEPQMLGVDRFTESGVVIKLMLKTHPERMFPIRRELLRRIKKAFDEAGIQPGFPQRVVRGRSETRD